MSWAIWSCMDWSVSQTHKSVHASSHCSAHQKVCACIYVYISPIVDYWTADCRLEHFDVAQPWAVMPRVLFYHKAHMWCEVSNQSDHLTPIKNMFYFIYCKKSNNVRKCSRLIHHKTDDLRCVGSLGWFTVADFFIEEVENKGLSSYSTSQRSEMWVIT